MSEVKNTTDKFAGPPPLGGHRREMSPTFDVVLNEDNDGIVMTFQSRDPREVHLRFDFSQCENLQFHPAPTVEATANGQCSTTAAPGSTGYVGWLAIVDKENASKYELKYRVMCLVTNSSGQLVPIDRAEPERQPAPEPATAAAPAVQDSDDTERENLGPNVDFITTRQSDGYAIKIESRDDHAHSVRLDFSGSENLRLELSSDAAALPDSANPMLVQVEVASHSVCAFGYLRLVDTSVGSAAMEYKVLLKKGINETALKQQRLEEEAAARAKAEEEVRAAEKAAQAEAQAKAEAEAKALATAQAAEKATAPTGPPTCALCKKEISESHETRTYKSFSLHAECFTRSDKCDFCGEVLVGEYVVTKGSVTTGKKLHKDCIPGYKKQARPTCTQCGEKIMDEKWTTTAEGKHYHTACRTNP